MSEAHHRIAIFSLVIGALLAACPATASHAAPRNSSAGPGTLQFMVAGMSCSGCAQHAAEALREIKGVEKAEVNFKTQRATLRTDGKVTAEQVRAALGDLGFEAVFPGDPVVRPLSPVEKEGLDIETVSHGEAIVVEDHLAPGKTTVFDFFADWCGPCHLLTPKLERLVKNHQDIALRKVDVSNWDSAAARQATAEFGMPGLPFVRIYDARGRLLGTVHGNRIEQVESIVKERRKQ